jgi:hypothetical protein
MRYTADTGHPFDTDNPAWQPLLPVIRRVVNAGQLVHEGS